MEIKLKLIITLLLVNSIQTQSTNFTCEQKRPDYIISYKSSDVHWCNVIENLTIVNRNVKLNAINVADVTRIEGFAALNKEVFYFPQGIEDIFKNSFILAIKNCHLKEINAQDLENFNLLQYIDLSDNEIEVLEENVFNFGVSILTIILNNNRIKFVHQSAFKSTGHNYLDLRDNACISDRATDLTKVPKLIKLINDKCPFNSSNIEQQSKIDSNESANNHSEMTQNTNDSTFSFKDNISYGLIMFIFILIIITAVYIISSRKSSIIHEAESPKFKNLEHEEHFGVPKPGNVYECQAIYEEIKYNINESEPKSENLEIEDFYVDVNENEKVEATESYAVVYKSTGDLK